MNIYIYHITEQLFDNLGGRPDMQIITVEDYLVDRNFVEEQEKYIRIQKIHNTKFYTVPARSNIFSICDEIRKTLIAQWLLHVQSSNHALNEVLVMKLQYRTGLSRYGNRPVLRVFGPLVREYGSTGRPVLFPNRRTFIILYNY